MKKKFGVTVMDKKTKKRKRCSFIKAGIVTAVISACVYMRNSETVIGNESFQYLHSVQQYVIKNGTSSWLSQVHAASLEDVQEEKENLEQKKEETENKVAKLEQKKSNILEYIEELDAQMADLDEDMEKLSADISVLESNLDTTRGNLAVAKETEEKQYELMKKRIKYMYESGNNSYIDIFFQSDSFYDMLNSAEYISKISSYDKNLFESYMAIKEAIETEEALLSKQLTDLQELKAEYEYEKETVEKLTADKKKQLKAYNKKIKSSEKAINEYDTAIAEQEKKIEQLLMDV